MSDYRNGAQACRLILRTLPSIDWCASDSESQSVEEYFVIQQAAIRAILSSAGPMSVSTRQTQVDFWFRRRIQAASDAAVAR